MKNKSKYYFIKLIIYMIIFLFILFYSVYVLRGNTGFGCVYTLLFNHYCPSCGATRAVMSLLNFDLSGAIGYNPVMTLAVLPIAFIYIIIDIIFTIINVVKKDDNYLVSPFVWLFIKNKEK